MTNNNDALELMHAAGGCGGSGCPTVYETNRGTYVVQGYAVGEGKVIVPRTLLASMRPNASVRAVRSDAVMVSGRPVDPSVASGLGAFGKGEALVEVPRSAFTPRERTFQFTLAELDEWTGRHVDLLSAEKGVAGVAV